ncbi:actinodin2 [Hoplias malabaricus]|uniref:actinodin2 n=1 Tax=Hoplias malabaricus TaxID=27720 RepID=UPI0034631576
MAGEERMCCNSTIMDENLFNCLKARHIVETDIQRRKDDKGLSTPHQLFREEESVDPPKPTRGFLLNQVSEAAESRKMAKLRLSFLFTGIVLTAILMPDFLGAGPVGHQEKEEGSLTEATEEKESALAPKKLSRHRRNIAYYQRLPEFWNWYKYFMDTHNQEGIENLDQVYRIYLQSKHRVEEGRSYNHYLSHLSEIYKACANSDDPDCIAESTSKPTAKIVMPSALRQSVVKVCNPYLDPYCLYSLGPHAPSEAPSPPPAPVKAPAPFLNPLLPMPLNAPLGYYYAPVMEPLLSAEQRSELLRICNPSDVECLQYHLRAAYGYKPALSPAPSYAHLACNPAIDPYCRPTLVARAPSGLYHLYPSCNPAVDPLCVSNVAPAAQSANSEEAPNEQYCNPLFDKDCNPLTAAKLAGLTKPVLEYAPKDEPAPLNLACDPRYDPYCLIGGTAALLKPPPQLPQFQSRSRLGVRGKTKEGYDCFVFYDKDCTPLEAHDLKASAPNAQFGCHPYDPNCGKISPQVSTGAEAGKSVQDGIIEPHPDCDPEIDFNCRLRRANSAVNEKQADEAREEPSQQDSSHGDPSTSNVAANYQVPKLEDVLRGYLGQYKK